MAATAQRQQTDQQQAQPPQSRGAVAVIAPPRLPYHDSIADRFGVDKSAWKALCESVFPTARTSGAIILALSYCKARKLDPFKKPVHIVPIYDSVKREYVESVWPGIGEHRTTAFRTGSYAGMDEPVFGPDVTHTFKDRVQNRDKTWRDESVTLTFPSWCRITVHREVNGKTRTFPGPRVYWMEFYSRMGRTSIPNDRWQKAPAQMLEKCAEAGALRRAFPEELGEDWTADEAGFFGGSDARDVTPESGKASVPAEEPTRAQFRQQQATDVEDDGSEEDAGIDQNGQGDDGATDPSGDGQSEDASATAGAEPHDWTIPNAATEHQSEIFEQMVAEAKTPADVEAIKDANAALLRKWGTGKPNSGYAKALEAANGAVEARLKALAG